LVIETSPEAAEEAVEHICFLADANQLYDHALGVYDPDVALLVAQQSQKVIDRLDIRFESFTANTHRILENIFLICGRFKKCRR
jgi:hypothetical protein